MSGRPRDPLAGGFALALGSIGGFAIGGLYGQPSLGLLIGLAGGAVIALAVWLTGR